jgi:predicted dehydrogenase
MMQQINVGLIGTGWCGGIRARTSAGSPYVNEIHISEVNPDRLTEVAAQTNAVTATIEWEPIVANPSIDAVMISATPESTHYPMAKACLEAGKHVLLEKPISLTLDEADELIEIARSKQLKFTIGYSQRFNVKQALIKQRLADGTLGEPVSALISRHISRKLGDKIGGRIKLSPAAMEATHDIDFMLWCLAPSRPVRVYAQAVNKVMQSKYGIADCMSIVITMDNGVVITINAGWVLPGGYPNFNSTWMEIVGSEGALIIDDTHRDTVLNTMSDGMVLPLSTMPGEDLGHVFAGPMHAETLHFIEAVVLDRDVMVKPDEARLAMEVYLAADLSAELNLPIELPMTRDQIAQSLAIAGLVSV